MLEVVLAGGDLGRQVAELNEGMYSDEGTGGGGGVAGGAGAAGGGSTSTKASAVLRSKAAGGDGGVTAQDAQHAGGIVAALRDARSRDPRHPRGAPVGGMDAQAVERIEGVLGELMQSMNGMTASLRLLEERMGNVEAGQLALATNMPRRKTRKNLHAPDAGAGAVGGHDGDFVEAAAMEQAASSASKDAPPHRGRMDVGAPSMVA